MVISLELSVITSISLHCFQQTIFSYASSSDFTLVSQSVGRSFKLAQLRGLRACFDPKLAYASSKLSIRSFHVGLILEFWK